MPDVRKRTPFSFAGDSDDPLRDTTVLDDQEQEQVVQTLKTENDASDRQIWLLLRVVMGFFTFLHALYLFRRENPLNPFLSYAEPPRIPFDVLLALLHTAIVLSLVVFPRLDGHIQGTRTHYLRLYAAAAIAPIYCALTGQGLTNFVWWCFALTAVVLHHSFHTLIRQGEASISQLEGLKYDARGA
ncbi:hypothetical protein H4582DRAFT_1154573 [Lactarius indigo]|nr:hypothetical protein H4582DRAFT_1154573 [Lactarius indigo]